MSEGSVVIITGKFDERVRKNKEDNVVGTVVKIDGGEVWVILPDVMVNATRNNIKIVTNP